jgi:DNA-binding NtrC family response regulator
MQERHTGGDVSKYLPADHRDHKLAASPHSACDAEKAGTEVSRLLAAENQQSQSMPYVVGESPRMREIYTIIRKAAPWDANVCIEGENGTGKELIARALHFTGPRRDRPFVTLDCSTIAEGLIESHLFGHVKGAFTGAISSRQGVFAQGHTGTVFIDEITELASHLQAKLLRVIQAGEFVPVGGSQPQRVNVRIITATNRDLRQAVVKGTFREDLYFRIAVVHLAIPPLRDRRKDIPLLVSHFLREFMASGHRQDIRGLTSRAMNALMNYSWPGNVRQLKNWIEQALVLADGDLIDLEHFPSLTREAFDVMQGPVPIAPLGLRLEELERWYVLETLRRADGNRTKAARQLGISLRGLQYKLRRYGTNPGPVEPDVPGSIPGIGSNGLGGMRQWYGSSETSANGSQQ